MSDVAVVPTITAAELVERYDAFLLDAYGVLVTGAGALPGARAFLQRLRDAGKPFLVVSNDASRSPLHSQARYAAFGLQLPREAILTSGLLLADHFAAAKLQGALCIVMGTDDSKQYVRDAGGIIAAPSDDSASVLVIGDDDGFPFLETANAVISVLLRRRARGDQTALILPNPDLIFPDGHGGFGITAGAIAALFEAILRLGDRDGTQRFVALGKPNAPIFEAALARLPGVDKSRVLMIGDQLATDILGATRFGLHAALVQTGVGRIEDVVNSVATPTYVLRGLD